MSNQTLSADIIILDTYNSYEFALYLENYNGKIGTNILKIIGSNVVEYNCDKIIEHRWAENKISELEVKQLEPLFCTKLGRQRQKTEANEIKEIDICQKFRRERQVINANNLFDNL